jgi:hypothetical protein
MGQHLVSDDLEEQRCHQREKLQEERRQQHFTEQPAIFDHRLQEPGDIETPREVGQRRSACHQDEASAPLGLEIGTVDNLRPIDQRVLNERPLVADLAKNDKATVPALGDRRQCQLQEVGPVQRDGARLQLQRLGAAEHFRHANCRTRELMRDLGGIDGNLVEAQQ